jgi:hypothetical protein
VIRFRPFSVGITGSTDYVVSVQGKVLTTNDLTDTLKNNYDGAVSHANSTHAPANAQANNISDVNAAILIGGGEISLHSHAGGSGLSQAQILTRQL